MQCLYSLVGRLEEYTPQTLALLPVPLRRQFLLHLPVRDVCRLEKDADFISGVDVDSIWRGLLQERILFSSQEELRNAMNKHPSAKDTYLSEVAHCLLRHERYPRRFRFPAVCEGESKSELIAYLLFGVRLEYDAIMSFFTKCNSLGGTWVTPLRYAGKLADVGTLALVKMFLNTLEWYPKRLDLTEDDLIDEAFHVGNNRIFQSFMSHVESVHVDIDDFRNSTYAESLQSVWLAVASSKPSSFNSVTLSACATNLGECIITLVEILFTDADEKVAANEADDKHSTEDDEDDEFDYSLFYKFSGLKKLELLANDGGTHPHEYGYEGYLSPHMSDLVQFLNWQDGLETLVIEEFQNIVKTDDENRYGECESSYEGFEEFYNYLSYVISKPSFKYLRVKKCSVPVNAVECMISTFLSCPTSHDQSLEIQDCYIVDECTDTFPDFPLIKPARNHCICGEYKSLSLSIQENNRLLPPQWPFDYPSLQLKRLEFNYCCFGSNYLRSVLSCPRGSNVNLCYKIVNLAYMLPEGDARAIHKFLELPSLMEVDFISCHSEQGVAPIYQMDGSVVICEKVEESETNDKEDDTSDAKDDTAHVQASTEPVPLLTVLTDAFSQPLGRPSLRRLQLKNFDMFNGTHSEGATFRSFFDGLFSMPKEQLAEFTLELRENNCFDYVQQQELVKAWKANSHGQRLKKFIFRHAISGEGVMNPIFESVSGIAVNADIC